MLVLRGKNPGLFNSVCALHNLDGNAPATFLTYFAANGTGDQGWRVVGSSQQFSGDQFAPLLYLLECVAAFGTTAERTACDTIMGSLLQLERTGTPLSNSTSGKILPNLGYIIDVLCDSARYNMTYDTTDMDVFLVPCLGDINCARAGRRAAYKEAFSVALQAQAVAAANGQDEFSFFNAIALVTLQAIAWGAGDSDVQSWRNNFAHFGQSGDGPAFQIAAGLPVSDASIDSYKTLMVCSEVDNDVIMAQRPSLYVKGTYPSPPCQNSANRTVAMDYLILEALMAAWN